MKTSKLLTALLLSGSLFVLACKEGVKKGEKLDIDALTKNQTEVHGPQIKEDEIKITNPLDTEMVTRGKGIYEIKCKTCHYLNEVKLLGPGWKNVTKRRQPAWIMNMITNVDMMLESDPEAQKLLEQCNVRMPNMNIMFDEARRILEFMRSNDGEK
jgi:cytochrome c2